MSQGVRRARVVAEGGEAHFLAKSVDGFLDLIGMLMYHLMQRVDLEIGPDTSLECAASVL